MPCIYQLQLSVMCRARHHLELIEQDINEWLTLRTSLCKYRQNNWRKEKLNLFKVSLTVHSFHFHSFLVIEALNRPSNIKLKMFAASHFYYLRFYSIDTFSLSSNFHISSLIVFIVFNLCFIKDSLWGKHLKALGRDCAVFVTLSLVLCATFSEM